MAAPQTRTDPLPQPLLRRTESLNPCDAEASRRRYTKPLAATLAALNHSSDQEHG